MLAFAITSLRATLAASERIISSKLWHRNRIIGSSVWDWTRKLLKCLAIFSNSLNLTTIKGSFIAILSLSQVLFFWWLLLLWQRHSKPNNLYNIKPYYFSTLSNFFIFRSSVRIKMKQIVSTSLGFKIDCSRRRFIGYLPHGRNNFTYAPLRSIQTIFKPSMNNVELMWSHVFMKVI